VSSFRNWVRADGSSEYKAEKGRYVLYVSLACPWANRCYIVRNIKGLQKVVDLVVVEPKWGPITSTDPPVFGWVFPDDVASASPRSTPDHYNQSKSMRELYLKADPDYSGKFTVPVLWDLSTHTIVNNESSEIIKMFNDEFNELAENKEIDLYPSHLRLEIDSLNDWMYNSINNGVYRCGFATSQSAYEKAFKELFQAIEEAEEKLSKRRYLTGNLITEADIRLFATIIRFDPVYYVHFKTNLKRITDYPSITGWLKDLFHIPPIRETIDFDQIKNHYYGSHPKVNPYLIVPLGPIIDLSHDENSQNRLHLSSSPDKIFFSS